MKELKEHAEGDDLKAFLQVFLDLEDPDMGFSSLDFSAFRIGQRDNTTRSPRDIFITFSDWESKVYVLELINQNSQIWR